MQTSAGLSFIKSASNKPLWATTRDAIVVTALSVMVTVIVMAIYWWYTGEETTYTRTVAQAVVLSMASQYVYEYTGINNMIAESSLRYAKGSALSGYTSRRTALVYKAYYDISRAHAMDGFSKSLAKHDDRTESPDIRTNFDNLITLIKYPALCGAIVDYARGKLTKETLLKKYPLAESLLHLPTSTLLALESLIDRITEPIAYDIITGGLAQYTGVNGILTNLTQEELDKGNQRGQLIMAQLGQAKMAFQKS